jgi:hypothetical protein
MMITKGIECNLPAKKTDPTVRLQFEYVYFYQNRAEGKFIVHEQFECSFELPHSYNTLENPSLLKRLHEESAGMYSR